MALKIGNNAVANAFVGASQVRRAYKGGTLVYQGWGPSSEREFVQLTSPGGPSELLKVYGKSIVWAQLVKNGDFSDGTTNWQGNNGTISATGGILTWTATNTLTYANLRQASTGFLNGHKYFVSFIIKGAQANKLDFALGNAAGGGVSGSFDYGTDWTTIQAIISPLTATDFSLYIRPNAMAVSGAVAYFKGPIVIIDLTLLYGAGHEPASVAQFLADYPEYYPEYDPGSLQSNKTTELRAYDGGTLRGSLALNLATLTSGGVAVFPDGLRGVGSIRDEAEGSTAVVRLGAVDVGSLTWSYNSQFGYLFCDGLSAVLRGDSNAAPNGLIIGYSPAGNFTQVQIHYRDKIFAFSSAGRIGIYDSAYTDPAAFKAAMSGVYLIYELATPQTYTLDTPLPTDLTCEQGDILQRVSDNNCPFVGEMKFGL